MADVRFDIEAKDLFLKERLHALVVTGQLAPRDFEQAFVEEITVRIKADGRTLNRLEKQGNSVAEAIREYRLK